MECLLSGEKGEASYAQVAAELNMSEGAIKMAVLRLRRRYGELIRAEIAQTVTTPEEADEELRFLFACFAIEFAVTFSRFFDSNGGSIQQLERCQR